MNATIDNEEDLPSQSTIEWLNEAIKLAECLVASLLEDNKEEETEKTDGWQSGLMRRS